MIKLLCGDGNKKMQDMFRQQIKNKKSYNLIQLIVSNLNILLPYLNFVVPFDIFHESIVALTELIQWPNLRNQEILVDNEYIEITEAILSLVYIKETGERRSNENFLYSKSRTNMASISHRKHSMSMNKSQRMNSMNSMNMSMSRMSGKNKSEFKSSMSSEQDISLPKTNFMLSVIKFKSLRLLLLLFNGHDPHERVYYDIRRIISAEVIRMNLAYQDFFFQKFHFREYDTDLFFKYDNSF